MTVTTTASAGTAALEPADQAARDRIRADHDHTLFVVAGAGTGKTAALVSRVVALVAAGRTQLDDLAAITFTEAAAAELRDRIRGALETAARGDDAHVTSPEARLRCAQARARIDEAALTTLHGFAQRLLARFPIEAGVPPRFEVVDEIEAAIAFDEGWRELSEDLLADPELEAPLLTALTLEVGMRRWRDITATLHANWDRVPDPGPGEPSAAPSVVPDIAPLVDAIAGACALREKCDAPADKLLACIDSLQSTVEVLTTAVEVGGFDLLEALVALPLPKPRNYGVQANWSVPKTHVKAALDAVGAARDGCIDAVGRAVLDAVEPRLCAWVRSQARERTAAGRLEYHDLLVLARDLLRSNEQVRRAVAQRYRYVLIDEFQDTDPLQAELAALLAAAVDPSGKAWHDIAVEPGRLFFVGDPKQSIYRFRRADLLLYHRAAQRFGEHTVELATNFRSTPGVIGWVNDVFDGLLRDSAADIQAEPARLSAQRPTLGDHPFDGPPVATFGTPLPESAAELRVREAADIAGLVQSIVGRWRVVDPHTHEVRAARHHDVAILLPTRLSLDAVDRALDEADIAARVESRSLVFATSEVRDLLATLQAVDDPADPLAVVAALRSPGLACSDRALAEWARAGGRWDYRVAPPDAIGADHDVAVAMATLAQLHGARHARSVSDTVGAVISECGLDLVAV
ncbi:MAG TPA: UvrD-helicase domain-containing protein, partial [Acidimicrobiia bacterium]